MNFQSESCVAVVYSIHFQPLVTKWFLEPGRLIFKWFLFFTRVYFLFSIRQLRALLAEV